MTMVLVESIPRTVLAHDTFSENALFLSFLVMWSLYPFILGQASPAVFCQKLVAKTAQNPFLFPVLAYDLILPEIA